LIIGFKVTVKNVGDVFLGHSVYSHAGIIGTFLLSTTFCNFFCKCDK